MVDAGNEVLKTVDLQPIAWGFRGYDMFQRVAAEKWSASRAKDGRGVDCIVLSNSVNHHRIWFAARQGFPLVRTAGGHDKRDFYQFDIETRDDDQWGWLPKGWKFANVAAGDLRIGQTATVTDLAVNVPVDPKLFDIDFPPGTDVYNSVTKENYIVPEGRGKSPILETEKVPGAVSAGAGTAANQNSSNGR